MTYGAFERMGFEADPSSGWMCCRSVSSFGWMRLRPVSSSGVAGFRVDGAPRPSPASVTLANGFSSIRLWARCSVTHCTMACSNAKLVRCVLTSRAVTMRLSSRVKRNKVTKHRKESYPLAQDVVKYYSG